MCKNRKSEGGIHLGTGQSSGCQLSHRVWRRTAARLTDHVWTTSELLAYRVLVGFLDSLEQIETIFPPLDDFDPVEPVVELD
jgi:uncharacterized protein YjaG (DUF416 family)